MAPSPAFAHGKSAPVATDFQARIVGAVPDPGVLEAKVVDGDRDLWLRVRPDVTVLIPGAAGEPLLRFDRRGVFVNVHSLTAVGDQIDRYGLDPSADPHAPPRWHRLTSGHAYLWHEHRLHALEPLAGSGASRLLGSWRVPLVVNGQTVYLRGQLAYRRPGATWPWYVLAAALALAGAGARALLHAAALVAVNVAALGGAGVVWALRIGRELYGRPSVGPLGYLTIALTCFVGLALVYGLSRKDREVRLFVLLLAGVGCLYQGLTMLPVLDHAVALTLLPTAGARAGVAVALGVGAGVTVYSAREQLREGRAAAVLQRRREARA